MAAWRCGHVTRLNIAMIGHPLLFAGPIVACSPLVEIVARAYLAL